MENLTYYCDNERHLVCKPYSEDNLHKMAQDLGIKRCWFHSGNKPHYDIPKSKVKDIALKCVIITPRQVFNIITGNKEEKSDVRV